MALERRHFGIACLVVAVVMYVKPELAVFASPVGTTAASFVLFTLFGLLYRFVLYPKFFTPLKHIPTPHVSHPHAYAVKEVSYLSRPS